MSPHIDQSNQYISYITFIDNLTTPFTITMKLNTISLIAAVSMVARGATALSLLPNNGNTNKAPAAAVTAASAVNVNRRAALTGVTAATAAAVVAGSVLVPTAATAADFDTSIKGAEAFVGTFTDPINHPGGKRTVVLLDDKSVGDYQLAEIRGGGGRGEPKSYVLPAAIFGNRLIVIDFSPKGGPRDFYAILDKKNGDLLFQQDGNRWPRQ